MTGRSDASRERDLVVLASGDVAVHARETGAPADQLRHYVAAARRGQVVVVGNGTQVLPLAEDLADSTEPLRGLWRFDYEPDEPIFTPRIWITTTVDENGAYVFGYAIRSRRPSMSPDWVTWTPGDLSAGEGMLMSTYDGTASNVSTARTPVDFTTATTSPSDLLQELWTALDPELRVGAMAFDPTVYPSNIEILTR